LCFISGNAGKVCGRGRIKERATLLEKTICRERAIYGEKTRGQERARSTEKTRCRERAITDKKYNGFERVFKKKGETNEHKKSKNYEHCN
jgi:hypothetical protein